MDDLIGASIGGYTITELLGKGGGVLGTPHYMAPEWAEADEVTHSVDIYALGVMLYEMLVGQAPYDGHNPMAVLMGHISQSIPDILEKRPDLPFGMRDVIHRGLAKTPKERFATAAIWQQRSRRRCSKPYIHRD